MKKILVILVTILASSAFAMFESSNSVSGLVSYSSATIVCQGKEGSGYAFNANSKQLWRIVDLRRKMGTMIKTTYASAPDFSNNMPYEEKIYEMGFNERNNSMIFTISTQRRKTTAMLENENTGYSSNYSCTNF